MTKLDGQELLQDFDLVIEPERGSGQYWRDLWAYRELFYFLAWRDILVRYKQTAVGIAWGVLRPLLTMIVFTTVFGKFAKLPSENVPYPILVLCGLLPWQMFASALAESSSSLVDNANLLTKVYFPRLIVPASSVLVGLVDFLISLLLLVILMGYYGIAPSWRMVALPLFLLSALLLALGCGFWISAINVKYRDFRYVVPFLVQCGLYISPVGFTSRIVPENWRILYSVNPMVGVIEGFRWALLGKDLELYLPGAMLSSILSFFVFFGGVQYFRGLERNFADVV